MENQQQSAEDEHPNAALINSFCEITCSSKSEALFFLESHNFDLDSAVSTFLETATDAANVSINPTTSATTTAAINHSPSRSRSPSYSPAQSESSSHSRSRSPSPRRNRTTQYNLRSSRGKAPSSSAAASTGAGRRTGGPIRTLADLNNRASNDDDESDTDPDFEPSEYYTGGEKSGMLVQDPSKGQDVDSIFSDARQLAVGEGSSEIHPPISNSKSFTGTARLLSGDTNPVPTPQQPEDRLHNITFWNNGFTVNDGPLRSFDDPQNAPFLESIRRSECPEELEPLDQNKRVHVRLMRKEENFAERRQGSSFHGVGRTLGSTTEIIGGGSGGGGGGGVLITAPAPAMGLIVDETRPITSIQLRLGDGTRMVSRFNIHHTIRDIRGFIDASRPGGPRAYQLQTVGFPPKQLVDLEQTIEQAGLANSVVIQNLC